MNENQKLFSLTVAVLTLLGIGTLFYRFQEGLTLLDSLYFSIITLTTVGYGDISPQTPLGKIFTIFYLFFGLGVFATYISILGQKQALRREMRKVERNAKKED